MTRLIGKDNVSNVGLEKFGDRFSLASTIGKLANIVSEIPPIKSVAEDIKCVESEDAILALHEEKNISPDMQERLCLCLCQQFSLQAIEWGRQLIAQGQGWEFADLRENLLTLAEVQGVNLPEADEWIRVLENKEELYRRRRNYLLGMISEKEAEKQRLQAEQQALLMDRDQMIIASGEKKKIGPNAPCPCGSGKKYKKCCGRLQ